MRLKAKTDSNHKEIVEALRKAGRVVLDLSRVGQGCPDLAVSWGNRTYLLEIKSSKKAKLTHDQIMFIANWKDKVWIVTTIEEAIIVTSGAASIYKK